MCLASTERIVAATVEYKGSVMYLTISPTSSRVENNSLVGTGVSADTDVLDGVSESDETLGVRVREGVLTGLDGLVTQSGGKEFDVGSFVLRDLGDTASDPVGETGVLEVVGGELGKGARADH